MYDIRGYNPITGKKYLEFANDYLTKRGSFTLADAVKDEKAFDLMSVKYIICPNESGCLFETKDEEWKKEYEDDNVSIYQNPHFLPRAYIAYDYLPGNASETIKLSKDGAIDIYSQVEIDNLPDNIFAKQPGQSIKKAEIVKYSANEVVVKTQTDKKGILVLTDYYDDGWQVQVNNKAEPLLSANDIFRGVVVPAGESEIVFNYLPGNFYLYLFISIGGLVGLIGTSLGLLYLKQKRR
ncbi:MAG: hypothetical protein ACD_68C00001G0003 [uncultured bacterium]|nr:MAG: hypothetical protein ACD_68C00001G0003 [uncultured bacterium]